MKYWMVARTTKGKEVEVAAELKASGRCDSYCPMRIDLRRPRHMKLPKGKFVEVKVPLFPRYIFWRGYWSVANSLKNITGILRTGDQIARIRDDDLQKLRDFEKYGFADCALSVESSVFASGDRVEIIDGVMEGKKGIFVGSAGPSAVVVDVQRGHFNGHVRIQIPIGMIGHDDP